MKTSTKDKLRGKIHEIKGQVKQAIGEAANKPALAKEGRNEKMAGMVQTKAGQVKKAFGR